MAVPMRCELVVIAAVLIVFVVASVAPRLYPGVSVVAAYLDGSHEVTLIYASCSGHDVSSLWSSLVKATEKMFIS